MYSWTSSVRTLAPQLLISQSKLELTILLGRQYAFNLTVLCTSIFGLALGGPSTYNGILVLAAFVGFGVGGNIPIDTTICLEFLPQNRRFLLALLSVFQPIGVVICSGIAYGFIPKYSCAADLPACNTGKRPCCTKSNNMGWRYLLITLGVICLCVFFLRFVVFRFQESPKFLLYRGRDDKAVKVLQHIARFNQRECSLTMETFNALTDEDDSLESRTSGAPIFGAGAKQLRSTWKEKIRLESSRYKLLFSNFKIARLTILVWITYIFDYWGFSIAGTSPLKCSFHRPFNDEFRFLSALDLEGKE